MNKEINQTSQEINKEDILQKKLYRVWFFTNERINSFFPILENQKGIRRVFSIGGGGDFVFSLLATPEFQSLSEINIGDIRPMANISIDFKSALFKNLEYQEILELFLAQKPFPKKQTYARIRATITPISRKIFDNIIENCKTDNFLKCLRKSGLWYRDSFWQIKNKGKYLPYLAQEGKYRLLQKNLDKKPILDKKTIYSGDFNKTLKLFQNNYYDLIYVSNVLDSKQYCRESGLYLQTIKEKLSRNGLLLVVTQNNPKKIIKAIEEKGFSIREKQLSRFNIISAFLGHYAYSFLLFRKNY
jgi:hypothetical protein